jgi:hypothetical protein
MDDLLSLSRMARRLGVTQQWLRDEAEAGRVPCLPAGNRYLFNPSAVEEALAARAAETRLGADPALTEASGNA